MEPSTLICVKRIRGKGRGVVAKTAIRKGAIIERAPVLLVPITDLVDGHENRTLKNYFYVWNDEYIAVSLGYGTLYNHSYEPNAVYSHGNAEIIYHALRKIAAGEEITINYNFVPNDKSPVLFDVV